jgi:hypothetical protein
VEAVRGEWNIGGREVTIEVCVNGFYKRQRRS